MWLKNKILSLKSLEVKKQELKYLKEKPYNFIHIKY